MFPTRGTAQNVNVYVKLLCQQIDWSITAERARLRNMTVTPFPQLGRALLASRATGLALSVTARSEEIRLSEADTPGQADAFYIDDLRNEGLVTGAPQGQIVRVDRDPGASITVGDLFDSARGDGRIRKFFLMFRLPEKTEKKLARAELSMFLGFRSSDKTGGAIPPLHFLHAKTWPDGSWQDDADFRGLTTAAFSDNEMFTERVEVGDDIKNGPVSIDVTQMVQDDYERSKQPVAVFRIEISDGEGLDVTDDVSHTYNFWGPGQAVDKSPGRAPTLNLTFE